MAKSGAVSKSVEGDAIDSVAHDSIGPDILRAVIDNSADGIIVADEHGRFLIFNAAAERMVGIGLTHTNPEDWTRCYGCYLSDGVTPFPADQLPLTRAIRGESLEGVEMLVRNRMRPEGVMLSCQAKPLLGPDGRLRGGVVIFRDITRQRAAEAEIQKLNGELRQRAIEQETRYRLAAKATRDAIYDWHMESGSIEWNEGLLLLFGHGPDAAVHHINWWTDHIHPDDRDRVVKNMDGIIVSGASMWSDEYRFGCADGSYALVIDRGYIVRDRTGKPVRMVGAMQNITERKRAEEAIARSLSLLEATLDSTADGILVVDEIGKIVSFNRRFVELWQIPEAVIATRDDSAALQHALGLLKDPEAWLEKVRELYARPEAVSFDTFELKDGRVFERYSQPRWSNKRAIGRVWSFRDITQRARAEENLQREREFLKTILENLAEGIAVCDPHGNVTLLNRAMRELYKMAPDQQPSPDWADSYPLYHADGKTRMRREEIPLFRALSGEQIRNVELVTYREDGQMIKLLINGNAIVEPNGQRSGAVLILHDVTEHDRLQRQLQQAQKLESIGTLAGGIAHDFNNLLAVVLGTASVLLRDKTLGAKVRDSLKDIIDAAERGSALTHQLLAYARGGLQRLGPVDLNGVVNSVVSMLRRTTPPSIEFDTQLEPDLPAILADPSQIEQVLMNLCLNAVQASTAPSRIQVQTQLDALTPAQAVELELSSGPYVRLDVRDHGMGMDAATMERMFEPFFTTKFTGRGMGLAATLGIVNSHHGQIRPSSRVGEGTTMSVWLPLSPEVMRARTKPGGSRRVQMPGGSETILVIDDDVAVLRTVEQILASLGYCVVVRNDGESAAAFLDTNAEDIDLILMDMNVPRFTSKQLYDAVQLRCKGAPILLASGIDEKLVREAARDWNTAGYVLKPFSMSVLAQSVRRVLDR